MDSTLITKRLHISGLTPAITAEDISRRLSTFGSVKTVDGIGLLDGLGAPRKFGYITIETTAGKLAKCMNLLSGSTWKGAKLRFGEAKPDFAERIAAERQSASDEPPKKRRKQHSGVYAEDMSLVTPENAATRPGWKVTPLGRTMRPVKMRPTHPLPSTQDELRGMKKSKKVYADDGAKKKKKRVKDPDTRARRKAIDMTKWGSEHLKGMFLDLEVQQGGEKIVAVVPDVLDSGDESTGNSDDMEVVEEAPEEEKVHSPASTSKSSVPKPKSHSPPPTSISTAFVEPLPASTSNPQPPPPIQVASAVPENNANLALETSQSLNLLASLFGGKDEDSDWVGRESVGSDIDEDELIKGDKMLVDDEEGLNDFELVPKSKTKESIQNVDRVNEETKDELQPKSKQTLPQRPSQQTKLKDLFAPRDEEAVFSLLGHLDLDLELDDEVPFISEQPILPTESNMQPIELYQSTLPSSHTKHTTTFLDPKQVLFFPFPSSSSITKARPRDPFDVAKEQGWHWRDPAAAFYRTSTEEDIRKRWEQEKGELTREWKKRCREAGKVRRRRRGGVEDGLE